MGILSNNVLLVKKGRFGIPSIIVYRLLWGKSTSLFSSTNGNLGHLFMSKSMSQCSWWNSLTIWKIEVILIWKIEGVQIEVIFQSPPKAIPVLLRSCTAKSTFSSKAVSSRSSLGLSSNRSGLRGSASSAVQRSETTAEGGHGGCWRPVVMT